jgi:hypothetical protein
MGAGQGAARFAEEEEGWIRAAGKGGGRGASPVVAAAARPGSGRGEREREQREGGGWSSGFGRMQQAPRNARPRKGTPVLQKSMQTPLEGLVAFFLIL